MKVREKYYHLVERYLSHPNYAFNNYFLKFWNWFYKHQDEFTQDEK